MENETAVRSLAALAQINRLEIFRLLVKTGPNGLPAGDIARTLDLSATRASFHLKELEHAGLISATRDGRYVRYAVAFESVRRLMSFLTEDCCDGRPELCGADLIPAQGRS